MASARSRRSCSIASATRPSRRASAASSIRARPGRPAASSPSPATARSTASPTPPDGSAPARSPQAALSGSVYAPVGWATHYHADYVVPYWASTHGEECGGRRAYVLSLGRRLGPARGLHQRLCRPRAECGALRNAALAAAARTPPAGRQRSPRRSRTFPAPRRSSSRRRCAATSASRSASTSSRARRRRRRAHEDYAKKFEASDNLKWSLSSEAVAANQQPLGKAAAPAAQRGQPEPRRDRQP